MARRAGKLPVVMGFLGALVARPALASEHACAPLVVEADAAARRQWPGLTDRVRGALTDRDDIDTCARVALTKEGRAIVVRVVLPDGRATTRRVMQEDDVVPTLEALLLEPVALPAVPASPEPVATAVPPTPPPAPSLVASPLGPITPPAEMGVPARGPGTASTVRVELSVVTGARIGDGQTGVGLGALSYVDISSWLVGFGARVDRFERTSGLTPPEAAAELALLGGRRVRLGTLSLDLTAGPAVTMPGTTTAATQAGPTTPVVLRAASREDGPRVVMTAHLNFRAQSHLRAFVGIDGNVSPIKLFGDPGSEAMGLPAWTVGLSLGATVGTL